MVRDAARQVREMNGLSTPEPYAAAFYDWSDDPFGGGSHLWNVGCPSWELAPKIIRPRKDVPVYIVGEAYSDRQGWVEGALRASEMLLQQHFRLPLPVMARIELRRF
jgi:monoamine oxidase